MTLLLRYQADIWVEVDTDEEDVVSVVVDELTMSNPVDVLDGSAVAEAENAARARRIADACCWPSWDFGSRPI